MVCVPIAWGLGSSHKLARSSYEAELQALIDLSRSGRGAGLSDDGTGEPRQPAGAAFRGASRGGC